MRIPQEFDAFYVDTRDDVLLETLAITGDVVAARAAVRDAYAIAWHHWRSVSRLDDQVAWVRPIAQRIAQRRATARFLARGPVVDESMTATLNALAQLTRPQRKALVLAHLSDLSPTAVGREVGLPQAAFEETLRSARGSFSAAREITESEITATLEDLRPLATSTRWPGEATTRASGTRRRRLSTALGVIGAVLVMAASGLLVTHGETTTASLTVGDPFEHRAQPRTPAQPRPKLREAALLASDQVARILPAMTWTEQDTTANTSGNGLVVPCQQQRYADPEGLAAYIRTFAGTGVTKTKPSGQRAKGKKPIKPPAAPLAGQAWQIVELSASPTEAARTFATTRDWFAGCTEPRIHLDSTYALSGVGDEAIGFTLTDWSTKPQTITVAVARSGDTTLTVANRVPQPGAGPSSRQVSPTAITLAAAVNRLCGSPAAGSCAGPPTTSPIAALKAGAVPGMLSEFDLPQVTKARGPWVGTPVADKNTAAVNLTPCDRVDLWGKGVIESFSRTFVFPESKGELEFGLTQNVGIMTETRARKFIADQRTRVTNCSDAAFGLKVTRLRQTSNPATDVTTWQMDVELTDQRTVRMLTAIARRNGNVTQLIYVPSKSLSLTQEQFDGIVDRAVERLHRLDLSTVPE